MTLEVYHPKGYLQNVVDSITWLSGGGTGIAFQRVYQTIIINMGSDFTVTDVYNGQSVRQDLHDTIWINGKQEKTFMLENTGITAMYVIGLKYGMLPWLADLPAIETNELSVGASHWAPPAIFDLREQLLECGDIHQGFALIEQYLTRLLLKKDLADHAKITWLSQAIHTSPVEEICRTLGVTRKKLRSETQHYFGDSVKNLQGILRFNHTLYNIAHAPHQTLSALHTYYDQSHFINDFKARAGITPLQYKRLCRLYPGIQHTPNFISMNRETFLQFCSGGD